MKISRKGNTSRWRGPGMRKQITRTNDVWIPLSAQNSVACQWHQLSRNTLKQLAAAESVSRVKCPFCGISPILWRSEPTALEFLFYEILNFSREIFRVFSIQYDVVTLKRMQHHLPLFLHRGDHFKVKYPLKWLPWIIIMTTLLGAAVSLLNAVLEF